MGWSRSNLQEPHHHKYNDAVKKIDENILKLISERRAITNGKRFLPSKDVVEAWAKQLNMKIPEVYHFLHTLNLGAETILPNEKGDLISILPIMKKVTKDHVTYTITHAMQYENCSIVHLDISYQKKENAVARIQPRLRLEVVSPEDYQIRHNGMHGGGTTIEMEELVIPKLPDDLLSVSFSLIPYLSEFENKVTEIVLDQPIEFD